MTDTREIPGIVTFTDTSGHRYCADCKDGATVATRHLRGGTLDRYVCSGHATHYEGRPAPFRRKLYVGRMPEDRAHHMHIEVRWDGRRFAMTGELVDARLEGRGVADPTVAGGQNRDDLARCEPVEPFTRAQLDRLTEVWERWHLNDMRAGCEHQRELGWKATRTGDPDDKVGKPCPTCGYRYGSAWLFEPVPVSVIEEVYRLTTR